MKKQRRNTSIHRRCSAAHPPHEHVHPRPGPPSRQQVDSRPHDEEKNLLHKCPDLLLFRFKYDFLAPQPILEYAFYLLRVVLHDASAHKTHPQLRYVASRIGSSHGLFRDFGLVKGAEKMFAPALLLPNLGKASMNMDRTHMTMHGVQPAGEYARG
uniref:Uncharacterized protein n=1 Tax=Mycena chlorophos TaxID=658473 RepID=A0ABQ0LG23_MYCCL|nr:predicted protein [Mycena chlorophos]